MLVIGDKKALVDTAAGLGAEVWWAQRPEDAPAGAATGTDLTLLTDYTEDGFVDLVAGFHRVRPFAAVAAVSENALLPAAALNDRLGLRGASLDAVRVLTDKWAMRRRLAEHGGSTVVAALGSTAADLRAFGADNGFPFIAKPVAAMGSYGVTLVDGPERTDEAAERFLRSGATAFLMEEYLDGPEISVESFSFTGRHVVLTLTDKLVGAGFVEAGHAVPADQDEATTAEVVDLVGRFLDAVGLTDGPSHVEVKLTSRGPRVVEGHARRGGDRINDLVRLVHGIDMEELTMAWAMGRAAPLTERPAAKGGAAIRFVSAEQGRVVAVEGAEEVRGEPAVFDVHTAYAAGDRVGPTRWSLDRPGYVIATGDTPAEAAATAGAHAARIVFTVDSSPETADELRRADASEDRALSRELDLARHVGYERAD
ncbi:ATP-grasp domain-containing protein [Streptomyces lavendulocolor]|uniref:ATP-grasp domain-containing protein n=1 Tax=Streptomyces lavendulocolor TaxID=67316 RepID=UPI003409973B